MGGAEIRVDGGADARYGMSPEARLATRSAASKTGARTRAQMKLMRGDVAKCSKCGAPPKPNDCYCAACRAEYMRTYRRLRKAAREMVAAMGGET